MRVSFLENKSSKWEIYSIYILYQVTLTTGDPKENWQNDILINKIKMMNDNKIIKKNTFITKAINLNVLT